MSELASLHRGGGGDNPGGGPMRVTRNMLRRGINLVTRGRPSLDNGGGGGGGGRQSAEEPVPAAARGKGRRRI